eukprot:m.107101 g.107101  ORF g.107101 m.107101 type:complete len:622 (-) comp12732_c0_seq2:1031-2896(-)
MALRNRLEIAAFLVAQVVLCCPQPQIPSKNLDKTTRQNVAAEAAEGSPGRATQTVAEAVQSGDKDAVLKALIEPIAPSDFFGSVLERAPHHLKRAASHHEGLFTDFAPDDVEGLLSFVRRCKSVSMTAPGGPLRMMEDISFPDHGHLGGTRKAHWPELHDEDLDEQFALNVSIVLNGLNYRTQGVAKLVLLLEAAFEMSAAANLYHTPPGGQALELHYDPTEVFVLQLAGRKRWTVAAPLVPVPRKEDTILDSTLITLDAVDVLMDITMEPGDLLYMPRGTLHFATNPVDGGAAPSTHLTLAIAVDFWHSFEAALHVHLMRLWRPGMITKSTAPDVTAVLEEDVPTTMHPLAPQAYEVPAALLLHAAIRVWANQPPARLRRTGLIGATGDYAMAHRMFAELCRSRPTIDDTLEGMRLWDANMTETSERGLGSVISVARDLDCLKENPDRESALEWQALVSLYDVITYVHDDDDEYYDDRESGGGDGRWAGDDDDTDDDEDEGDDYEYNDSGADTDRGSTSGSEQTSPARRSLSKRHVQLAREVMNKAWDIFCSAETEDPEAQWRPVFAHLLHLERVRRSVGQSDWLKRLRAHNVDLDAETLHLINRQHVHTADTKKSSPAS